MPDLNDFYAFKMTRGDNSASDSNRNTGCGTVIIVLSVIGRGLWLIGHTM